MEQGLNSSGSIATMNGLFPNYCQQTNELSVYGDTKAYKICGTPVADKKGHLTKVDVIFFFSQYKLARIDLWELL